jgi:hypothetical protein
MERYIPYDKMSKKQKKEWDSKQRTLWGGNPVTRKTENNKHYNRKKVQRIDKSDFTEPLSFYFNQEAAGGASAPAQKLKPL